MNCNYHALASGAVRHSETPWWIGAALLAAVVLSAAGAAFYGVGAGQVAKAGSQRPPAHRSLSASSLTLPLFFEPNQGQSDARVKFLARGSGYGLFLTADEAVLELQQSAPVEPQLAASSAASPSTRQPALSVIRMRLDGASSAAQIRGTGQLPGKSSYFIGNDPTKWRRGIPQFARVEYQNVYPGIDLVYYGNQRQLEYDFRVAPGADANQIALSFEGASVRLDAGDLVLSTTGGDVRFHAPHIYQPGAGADSGANTQSVANAETPVQGSFRQLAGNKIGFGIGPYDRSRELVIDPVLSYSTYFGLGGESGAKVAVDSSDNIYLAFSTMSAGMTTVNPLSCPPDNCAILNGSQNIFIAKINPSASSQLIYATYLGGSGTDSLAGLAIDQNFNIFVAGTTSSQNFPTTPNAFQQTATWTNSQIHGFVSELSFASGSNSYTLGYSTYLAGTTGTDAVTGLAADNSQDAYVTGTTTSIDGPSNGFPSNPNAFQPCPFGPVQTGQPCTITTGPPQFFASKIHTGGTGPQSMLYSTYFGGANIGQGIAPQVIGGGIAVDASLNMYFTGGTNMQSVTGPNGEAKFPIYNAWQSCLNLNYQSGSTGPCNSTTSGNTDVILVKINPNQPSSPPLYSTYLGGRSNDVGLAVAVDTSSNAYVTGSTNSGDVTDTPHDWNCVSPCVLGPYTFGNGTGVSGSTINAFIAKVGNETQSNTIFPQTYFTWLGGNGPDYGQAIAVDSLQTVHLAGTSSSSAPQLPITTDALQTYQGNGDAFAALIATSASTTGDYVTYLGGSSPDQGTGIALDLSNAAYVAGSTQSQPTLCIAPCFPPPALVGFPITTSGYQKTLQGLQDAFVAKIGNNSNIQVLAASTSPSPNPVAAGAQAAFTFDLTNNGTDTATDLNFFALVPTTGIASNPSAKVTSGGGSCAPVQGNTIPCFISTLAVNASASVEVDVTPSVPATLNPIPVGCNFSVNGGSVNTNCPSQTDAVVDFSISANPSTLTIPAGALASFPITLTPEPSYNATITMSDTISPSIVTATTPTFTNPTVTLSGSGTGTTTLNIQTVARPVTTGAWFRRGPFYATWLPIGGLSLVGLGIGASRKRRRWLAGALLGLVASLILLQPACSSSSSPTSPSGGTQAGPYTINVIGSPSTGGSRNATLTLNVT